MDLSFVQEQLDTFATFAGAIGDFLQKPAEILGTLVDWFNGDKPNPATGDAGTTIGAEWDTTKEAFGSSKDAEPSTGDTSSFAGLSSKEDAK